MRVFILLFQLQVCPFNVKGFDLPRKSGLHVNYSLGTTITFSLRLNDLPKPPNGEHWTSAVYLDNVNSKPGIISGPYTYNASSVTHSYHRLLVADDDLTTLYVQVMMSSAKDVVFCKNIVTLHYSKNPSESVSLTPSGTLTVSAGDRVNVTCRTHQLPDNTRIVIYRDYNSVHTSFGKSLNASIEINERNAKISLYCMSYYTNLQSEQLKSNVLTVFTTDATKQNEVTFITEPQLSNVTYYRVGDRFQYKCTALHGEKATNVAWVGHKADKVTFNSSTWSASIDIFLDESYNNTDLKCKATRFKELGVFVDDCISTRLVLCNPYEPEPWPWYIILIITVVVLATLAIGMYLYTRRKIEAENYIVEVQNELYGAEYDDVRLYAQVYEQALATPPATVHRRL